MDDDLDTTVGELNLIVGEEVETMEIEWSIPDFLSFAKDVDNIVGSPYFEFLGEDWFLSVAPKSRAGGTAPDCIGACLQTESSEVFPFVDCSFAIKRAKGNKLYRKHFTRGARSSWGCGNFIALSQLLNENATLLPGGTLTVVCTLKNCDPNNISRTSELSQDFQALLAEGTDADVIACVDGEEFRLHKIILRTRAPYFAAMFQYDMSAQTTGMLTIGDCKADIFRLIVHYIYTGRVKLSADTVFPVFKLADMLQMENLKQVCLNCIKNTLSVDTFCDAAALLLVNEDEKLLGQLTEFLSSKTVAVMESEKWKLFLRDNLDLANKLLVEALKLKQR